MNRDDRRTNDSGDDDSSGYDSVDEDAELELSCALHDLALRVKTFEENMKGRFRSANGGRAGGGSDDDDDEITEDIPEMDDDTTADDVSREYGLASPKQRRGDGRVARRQLRRSTAKASKQQVDDDDDDDERVDDDGSDDDDSASDNSHDSDNDVKLSQQRDDWDFQEQTEELSEMRHNIALLLQGIKAEAKALEANEVDTSGNNSR